MAGARWTSVLVEHVTVFTVNVTQKFWTLVCNK